MTTSRNNPLDSNTITSLRRVLNASPAADSTKRCEMCSEAVGETHAHVVDLDSRELICACRACSYLFVSHGAAGGRYRAVPERYLRFTSFQLSENQWEALRIPVGMVFFFRNSRMERTVAFYPSPAGATESELAIDGFNDIVTNNPALGLVESDVEALLFTNGSAELSGGQRDRREESAVECFLVPIDVCYELVGHLRRLWRGFDGGQEVRARLASFFEELRRRARATSATGAGSRFEGGAGR